MFHLSDRELSLLGEPTRNQTLALVGWMVLANAFGEISDGAIDRYEQKPSATAERWIGGLSRSAQIRPRQEKKNRRTQDVMKNRRRKVRVRATAGALATGSH